MNIGDEYEGGIIKHINPAPGGVRVKVALGGGRQLVKFIADEPKATKEAKKTKDEPAE